MAVESARSHRSSSWRTTSSTSSLDSGAEQQDLTFARRAARADRRRGEARLRVAIGAERDDSRRAQGRARRRRGARATRRRPREDRRRRARGSLARAAADERAHALEQLEPLACRIGARSLPERRSQTIPSSARTRAGTSSSSRRAGPGARSTANTRAHHRSPRRVPSSRRTLSWSRAPQPRPRAGSCRCPAHPTERETPLPGDAASRIGRGWRSRDGGRRTFRQQTTLLRTESWGRSSSRSTSSSGALVPLGVSGVGADRGSRRT